MNQPDSKTPNPQTPNKPIRFGGYNVPVSIAHLHGDVACSLLAGAADKIAELLAKLKNGAKYSVFTMPAQASCIIRHHRHGSTRCEFRVDQKTDDAVAGAAKETQAAPPIPDPIEWPLDPTEDPVQICLCPDGEYTCGPEHEPDCGGSPLSNCTKSDVESPK